jgi:hypothetical protein
MGFFSGLFVFFVVQKEFLAYPADVLRGSGIVLRWTAFKLTVVTRSVLK